MANKILRDAVKRRRAEFPEQRKFLTDWQVHLANPVMSAISMKALGTGLDEGVRYLPFPTGSGKQWCSGGLNPGMFIRIIMRNNISGLGVKFILFGCYFH